jgi:hypothetical protein
LSDFISQVNAFPRDGSFPFRVIALIEQENQKTRDELRSEDAAAYEKKKRELREFKERFCPSCQTKGIRKKVYVEFIAFPLYGCHIFAGCHNCTYKELF